MIGTRLQPRVLLFQWEEQKVYLITILSRIDSVFPVEGSRYGVYFITPCLVGLLLNFITQNHKSLRKRLPALAERKVPWL
jgi:hypothetical protein